MSMQPTDRRARKRLATRQAISDTATLLFLERGFDAVTIDEIAEAADVGRMTVFNHFPRKEDLFFDRDEEGRKMLRDALRHRDSAIAPVKALRRLAHRLVEEDQPYLEFSSRSQAFIATVLASETLKARARAIRDEFAQLVREGVAASLGRDPNDPDAHLVADLLVAIWTVAFRQAHRTFRDTHSTAKAKAAFLAIVDQGARGLDAAMAGTPYA